MRESCWTREALNTPIDPELFSRPTCQSLSFRITLLVLTLTRFYRIGWKYSLDILPYGERFRAQRRMMQQAFNSNAIKDFRQSQKEQAEILCLSALNDNGTFFDAIQL